MSYVFCNIEQFYDRMEELETAIENFQDDIDLVNVWKNELRRMNEAMERGEVE